MKFTLYAPKSTRYEVPAIKVGKRNRDFLYSLATGGCHVFPTIAAEPAKKTNIYKRAMTDRAMDAPPKIPSCGFTPFEVSRGVYAVWSCLQEGRTQRRSPILPRS